MHTRTFLGLDSGEWQAIGACATAVITVALALYARIQLRDARNLRLEQARPIVVVDITFRSGTIIILAVTNAGLTGARNVRVEFDEPPTSTGNIEGWLNSSAFINKIPTLAPHRTLEFFLDEFQARLKAQLPMALRGTVSYDGPAAIGADRYVEPFLIDLNVYAGTILAEKSMHDLVGEVKVIRETLAKWAGPAGQGVVVHTVDGERDTTIDWRQRTFSEVDEARENDGIAAALRMLALRWRERHGFEKWR